MKKIVMSAMIGLALLGTAASADAGKGQKAYKSKLSAACGINGGKFAQKHTQDEWAEINEEGKLGAEIIKICPAGKDYVNSKKFKKKSKHYYDFFNAFASDSGNVPSC